MSPSRAFASRLNKLPCPQQARFFGPPPLSALRSYHSYHHPPPPGPFGETEQAILGAAYRHIPEHGFTQRALSFGARDAGFPVISTSILPEGPFSLIRYHLVTQREALASRSGLIFNEEESRSGGDQVPLKVERLTWERLSANRDVNHRWQEALAIMAQPSYIPSSLHELSLLADEIYHLAGDLSVDPTWYTKRVSLSMIYASSELFMTNDRSPNFSATRDFLQRRLEETNKLGSAVGNVAQWVGFTASAGINVLRSKGVRI